MSIRVTSFRALATALETNISGTSEKAMKGLRAGARRGQSLLMQRTPVDTGRLRASSRTIDTPEGSTIEQPTDYAGIVDYHQNHAGGAIDSIGDLVVKEIKKAVSR